MNAWLERLGRKSARHRWWALCLWPVVFAGRTLPNRSLGGNFVNDYTVPGSESSRGLDLLQSDFSKASGYSGQLGYHAKKGKVSDQSKAVSTTTKNLAAPDHVISAPDPLSTDGTPAVSKDGTIASGAVSW